MRLHRLLTTAMAVLLVIGLAVTDVVTYTALRSFLYGRLDVQLSNAQYTAVHYLVHAYRHGTTPTSLALSVRLSPDIYVIVLGHTGTVIATRPSGSQYQPNPRPVVPRSVRLSREIDTRGPYRPNPYNFTLAARNGTTYRAAAASVPQGIVIVAVQLAQTNLTMSSLVHIEIGVSAAVLLALCALALWAVRRGLRPLDDMAKTADEIASGADLGRRVEPADTDTEVGRLGAALNTMLGRLEDAFVEKSQSEARLRQFVADASHELRTPLTSIRGYAELLRRGAFVGDDDRSKALRRVEGEASRMSGLVDDLLLLARLDQGRPLERAPVDLRRVCRDAVDDAQLAEPDRLVELVAPAPVTVAGDRDRLAQVAHNLVRNALVHTTPGSPVRVEVSTASGMGVLRVVDEGPGLTAPRRERVFDRFYRGDPSRTGEGTGLGLSIARAIAEDLGGVAWVQPRTDREGSVFGVEVPLVLAPSEPLVPSRADDKVRARRPPAQPRRTREPVVPEHGAEQEPEPALRGGLGGERPPRATVPPARGRA